MFYKYRKQIITVLVIIVLMGDFLLGKSVESSSFKKLSVKTKSSSLVNAEKNTNYQEQINVNGQGYSSSITVDNAAVTSDGILNFNVIESDNSNVVNYQVIALGADNNVLSIQQTAVNADTKTYSYSTQFDKTKDTKVTIKIYPLTQDMKNNQNLKLDSAAYGESILNIDLIKQNTINAIKGTDGVINGQ